MATSEERISKLTNTLSELAQVAGTFEQTRIVPNLEVVNDSPADLPSDYVIIENEDGYYTPAVLVAGLTVSTGDFVNVLYVEGTEPIAIQQGSASPTPGGGGTWPAPGEVKIGTAAYSTIQEAINAASPGDQIKVGEGDYDEQLTIDVYQLSIVAIDPTKTRISSSSYAHPVTVAEDEIYLYGIGIVNTHSAADSSGLRLETGWHASFLRNCRIESNNSTNDAYGIYGEEDCDAIIDDCRVEAYAGGNAYAVGFPDTATLGSYVDVYGGYFYGADADFMADSNDYAVYFYGASVAAGGGLDSNIDPYGEYLDAYGTTRYVGNTSPTLGQAPLWDDANEQWVPGDVVGGVWPNNGEVKIGTTVYSSLAAAITAASTGDIIRLGEGTFSSGSTVNVNKAVSIVGSHIDRTIIQNSGTSGVILQLSVDGVQVKNLTLDYTGTPTSGGLDLYIQGACRVANVGLLFSGAITGSNSGVTVAATTGDEIVLENVQVLDGNFNDGGYFSYDGNVRVIGGLYRGSDSDIEVNQADVFLSHPRLHNADLLLTAGVVEGEWTDLKGTTYFRNETPAANQIQRWDNVNKRWVLDDESGVWPDAGKIRIDGSSIEYTTIDSAISASIDGDTLRVGIGTFLASGTITIGSKNLTIIGSSNQKSILKWIGFTDFIIVSSGYNLNLDNIRIEFEHQGTSGTRYAIATTSGTCFFNQTHIYVEHSGLAGSIVGIGNYGSDITLVDCRVTCDGQVLTSVCNALYMLGLGSDFAIHGGEYSSSGAASSNYLTFTSGAGGDGVASAFELPVAVAGSLETTDEGIWMDSDGALIFPNDPAPSVGQAILKTASGQEWGDVETNSILPWIGGGI